MPDQSYQGKLSMFPYDPRFRAIAPPTAGIFDEPQMSICFNVEWAAHIDGVLSRLLWTDAWAGSAETQQWAVTQITNLIVSMIARNPCGEGDCMSECCDDLIDKLDELISITKNPPMTDKQVGQTLVDQSDAYKEFLEPYNTAGGSIQTVNPELVYGDDNDAIRDQALCFICKRFVDLCCDWVLKNIELKQNNQQSVLNVASFIANASGSLADLLAETAFGQLFQNIQVALSLEVVVLTEWVTGVSIEAKAAFEDEDARARCACQWYEGLKGSDPTLETFLSKLTDAILTGNADVIRDKLASALVPVESPQSPDGEKMYFIWADLWKQAYDGAIAGIVPDCLCVEDTEYCYQWDFSANDGDWEPLGANNGTYVGGTGWEFECFTSLSVYVGAQIGKGVPSGAGITRVEVDLGSVVLGVAGAGRVVDSAAGSVSDPQATVAGDATYSIDIAPQTSGTLVVVARASQGSDCEGSGVLKRVRVYGPIVSPLPAFTGGVFI